MEKPSVAACSRPGLLRDTARCATPSHTSGSAPSPTAPSRPRSAEGATPAAPAPAAEPSASTSASARLTSSSWRLRRSRMWNLAGRPAAMGQAVEGNT
jgi:hypothetical protein